MALYLKSLGTQELSYQIGLGANGTKLTNNAGVLEIRNPAGAFIITRGLPALNANDYVTLSQLTANSSAASVMEIHLNVGLTTVSSVTTLPAFARIVDAQLIILTPYSAGTTISIGQTGSVAAYQATTDNNPQDATSGAIYWVAQDNPVATAGAPVLVTITGAPTAGVSFVVLRYVASALT